MRIRVACCCEQSEIGLVCPRADGLEICPYHALKKLMTIHKRNEENQVIHPQPPWQVTNYRPKIKVKLYQGDSPPIARNYRGAPLTSTEVCDLFLVLVSKCGIPISMENRHRSVYASHSCRRGGAQALARGEMPETEIKKYGRWRSDVVEKYIEDAMFESDLIGVFLNVKYHRPLNAIDRSFNMRLGV